MMFDRPVNTCAKDKVSRYPLFGKLSNIAKEVLEWAGAVGGNSTPTPVIALLGRRASALSRGHWGNHHVAPAAVR